MRRLFAVGSLLIGFLIAFSISTSFARSDVLGKETESNTQEYKKILYAVSSDELRTLIQSRVQRRFLYRVCDEQLRSQKVPQACFELKKSGVNLFKGVQITQLEADKSRHLDALCVESVKIENDLQTLQSAARNMALPQACRSTARTRANDLLYIQLGPPPTEETSE